jgi:hypothetical protein
MQGLRYGHSRRPSQDIGYEYATKAGISICINDMKIPLSKEDFIERPRRMY